MRNFRDIRVWWRSHQLVLAVYRVTERFPPRYRYGITQQLERAIASVPSNLAEGSKADSADDFARFINISEKSMAESQYLFLLHKDVGNLLEAEETTFQREAAGIARQLHALKEAVRAGTF